MYKPCSSSAETRAADASPGDGETLRRAKPLLGTLVGIEVRAADVAAAYAATDAAFAAVGDVHRLMSFHDPSSDVSRINRAAPGVVVEVDARTAELLALALDVGAASGGAFDCTAGAALARRRSLPWLAEEHVRPDLPSDGSGAVSARADGPAFIVDGRSVVKRRACLIDVGGIAKGYAVDRAVDAIASTAAARGTSFDHVLVNAGGDLRHCGRHAVPIRLRDPRWPGACAASFELRDGALAGSATSGPAPGVDEAASAHVDPRSSLPLPPDLGAAVHAPTCVVADALTKVALVIGSRCHPVFDRYGATVVWLAS